MQELMVFVGGLLLLMAIGLPVVVAIGITSFIALAVTGTGGLPVELMSLRMVQTLNNFTLLAIPLFILAANIMNTGSTTTRIFDFATALVGFTKGGLGHANVVASSIFATMSGTAVADAAGLGSIEIKAMKERGYDLGYSAGITAASSVIGPILPPSIALVVYGWLANVSIGALFMAGLVPGILMALLFMGMTVVLGAGKRVTMPPPVPFDGKEVLRTGRRAVLPLFMPAIIVGGIWTGLFTPTEAGAVASVYALILGGLVYRDLSLRDLFQAFRRTLMFSAAILLIIAVSSFYGWILVRIGIPQALAGQVAAIDMPTILLLLAFALFFLLIGCFMSVIESILIFTPIVVPAALAAGLDPIHFGIVMVITLSVGVITPPFGTVLFLMVGITRLRYAQIVISILPFLIPILLTILILIALPTLTTWLPRTMGY
ncbi:MULTISPECIES: TRAP transporter large permease [Halomonadaceae]|jgi:tripartite ATP-independent transporter DctM subunit|uniref:TRAP transporter large permease protein n=1 Tax=Billgrantia aerodenitrificans TaxID=2733483 RepID=A0ABS9ASX9_9GAMM|nr:MULTISPECIES: TRAP transporter large permease [Halomonas]MCE8012597.1 TRAP transporter large permease [Halomonas desiderata]MCE8024610.1 TRAP transporter large permease [Halomonas aerodenitrificans]MCE8038236.1 TRAP transporter large permease [Halomonas sp. MCCC 1A11062]